MNFSTHTVMNAERAIRTKARKLLGRFMVEAA
jgi:hypothetical protein